MIQPITHTDSSARRRLLSTDPRVADAALAALVVAFGVAALAVGLDGNDTPNATAYLVVVVAGGSVAARRLAAPVVLVTTITGHLFVAWDAGNDLALLPAAAIALYTIARHGDRRTGLVTASAAGAAMAVVSASFGDDGFALELLGEVAQAFLPIAVGDAMRTRADRIDQLVETEAAARVQAERLRIARDLHDVVAHGLSTISIQSGVAAHLLDRDPGQAKEALEIINATGKSSLEELRTMVGVLRSTDDTGLRPTPTDPDDLSDLVDAAAHAGIPITIDTDGTFPADVSDAAVVAVHRIVQEALTNVARHAGAAATTIRLAHHDDHVVVEVHNERPSGDVRTVASTGVGIVGMRERAESLGGSLDAEPTAGGGFRVSAVVPYYRHGA